MGVTINVNGLSLVHRASGGKADATLPDVCLTPSPGGPVPRPYPNKALSVNLAKGTRTVKVDGGNMAAVKGSEFSISTGDEQGVLGGVKSKTIMKEATWLSYSFDVKMEGKNACRKSDKMLMNHGNTACLAGVENPFIKILETAGEIAALCAIICYCEKNPEKSRKNPQSPKNLYEQCVENRLTEIDDAMGGMSPMKPEQPYNMLTEPPEPISKHWMFHDHLKPKRKGKQHYIPGDVRVPDVVIVKNPTKPPPVATQDNLRSVVEIKFLPGDPWDPLDMIRRRADYRKIAGPNATYVELDNERCCKNPKPEPVPVPLPVPVPERKRDENPSYRPLPLPFPAFGTGARAGEIALGTGLMVLGAALSTISAAGTGFLIMDDGTGVGVLDDSAIPVTLTGMATGTTIFTQGWQRLLKAFRF